MAAASGAGSQSAQPASQLTEKQIARERALAVEETLSQKPSPRLCVNCLKMKTTDRCLTCKYPCCWQCSLEGDSPGITDCDGNWNECWARRDARRAQRKEER